MSTIALSSTDYDNVKKINGTASQFLISKMIYSSGILNRISLSMSAKLVLMALANHYNPQKNGMFPSQKFMADQLGISLKSVERAIKELKNANLLMYVTKKVNRYYFTAKFFAEIKMSDNFGQNDGCDHRQIDAQTDKHEQKNNRVFSKKSNEQPRKPFVAQQKGVDYQPVKLDMRRDEQTPWNDFAVAQSYVDSLKASLHNAFVRQKVQDVCEHWNKQGHKLILPDSVDF